ncbi:glutamate receptor ionotropic, delta-2 isoform X2 [Halictus rubicundus]|uniref:glutamate receptor ionotropic, delta-2 isoform X2 n=1 Tax=Halictus rubicundus TaxID=77578 RepID=UPI004034FC25
MIVRFSDFPREAKKYEGYESRPLYVVLLSTKETMNEFVMATRQIDISFPVWFVMFLPQQGNPLKSFCQSPAGNPFNLLFNTEMIVFCYGQPLLREWYAFRDNRTVVSDLAVWTAERRLRPVTNSSLYARRNNLHREVLRIAYVQESTFVAVKDGVLTKFLGAVVEELSISLNFTMNVSDPLDSYGNFNEETKTWTGVIGELVTNMVDIGVADFSMTNHREDVVDFTLPLILSRIKVYFRKPDSSAVRWAAYIKEFDTNVWMGIVLMILSAPIILTLMKTRGRLVLKDVGEYYISVWGIYCQQGLSEFPYETPLRLAFLSIFISSLVVMSAYSASLISNLTISTASLPFTTLKEFAYDGSYKLIVFRDSADYDIIVSDNDSVSLRLQALLKDREDLPLTVADGFEQVCTQKVGFYITEEIVNSMGYIPCAVVHIGANRIENLAIALSERSPYRQVLNYQLQQFKDNGVLNKLKHMYLAATSPSENKYPAVTLGRVAPILSILACGVVVGCLVLMFEKMYYKFCEKRAKSCLPWKLKKLRTKARQKRRGGDTRFIL